MIPILPNFEMSLPDLNLSAGADLPEHTQPIPIRQLFRWGSSYLGSIASKAHNFYKSQSDRSLLKGAEPNSTHTLAPRYENRSQSAKELLVISKKSEMSFLPPIFESSPLVQASPELPSRTYESRFEIPSTPLPATPIIDNREIDFVIRKSESSIIQPVIAIPDRKYVTVKDMKKYFSQFELDSCMKLGKDLDSQVERDDVIKYVSAACQCDLLSVAPKFVNGQKYFTRQELVYLAAQLSLHFDKIDTSPNKRVRAGYVMEPYRPATMARNTIRKEIFAKQGKNASKIMSTVSSKTPNRPKASASGTKTHGFEKNPDKGTVASGCLSNADKDDGHLTQLAKKVLSQGSKGSGDKVRAEAFLLLRDDSPSRAYLLPHGPEAAHTTPDEEGGSFIQ